MSFSNFLKKNYISLYTTGFKRELVQCWHNIICRILINMVMKVINKSEKALLYLFLNFHFEEIFNWPGIF